MVRPADTLNPNSCRSEFINYFGKPIEQYAAFKRATAGMAEITMKSCRRMYPQYFLFLKQDPDAVIEQRKKDLLSTDPIENERYEKCTVAFLKTLTAPERKTVLSGRTVANHLARIQGFYTNNGKRLSLDMPRQRISKARRTRKYSPSQDEVKKVFNTADCKRDRLIVALMAQNGPAPVDISLLCKGDYPLEPWQYFERNRSKTGQVWRGISTPDVCSCLKEYLEARNIKDGERLFLGREGTLDSKAISHILRELIVKAGFGNVTGFKPTSLRDFFEDCLTDAEIYRKTKETLMAHGVGDIEQEYGGFKKMVARLTEAMQKVYPLICLTAVPQDVVAGFSAEDLGFVKELIREKEVFKSLRDALVSGRLVHVNDPLLLDRLRREGRIK